MVGDTKNVATLFGEKGTVDPVEHARQMAAFIEIKMRDAKEKGIVMHKICTSYGKPDTKGALAQGQYKVLHSKEDVKKATSKDEKGIVVEGSNVGQIFRITTAPADLKEETSYKQSPQEKAKRKADAAKAAQEKKKKDDAILSAIGRVKWPMSEKQLDVLFELVFRRFGYSYLAPVAARHGVKSVKTKNEHGYTSRDLETPLADFAKKEGARGKLKLIFEIALEATGSDAKYLKKI